MSDELLALAARCEAADAPDRELDVLIAVATDWRWDDWEEGDSTARDQAEKHGIAWITERVVSGHASMWRNIPRFTGSIDDAMTLLPNLEGIGWRMTDGAGGPTAEIWRVDFDNGATTAWEVGANPTATPALALCAAALKARAKATTVIAIKEGGVDE